MKNIIVLSFLCLLMFSCQESKKNDSAYSDEDVTKITTSIYPENITKVFDAHGGIDQWNTMKTLSFTMEKANGLEVTTTDLKSRKEIIDAPTYTLGFDGNQIWVNEKDGQAYKGGAWFYKGLFSYFYAMPFILGDSGIIYEETDPLVFEGKTYPGVLISYEDGVGESPDDEYIVYYNSETRQMEWLAYTVTFGKNEKSNNFHFIRYNNWQTVNEVLVPKSMDWYSYENNKPIEKQGTTEFTNVVLTKDMPPSTLFHKPETARIIER